MEAFALPGWLPTFSADPVPHAPVLVALLPAMDAPESPAPDAELFEQVRQGDTTAFATFFDRHSQLLFNVALRVLGNPHDAEDALAEASVLVWERAPLYDPMFGKPVSWAITLTRNKAIDRLRSRQRKAIVHDAAAIEAGFGAETEPEAPQAAMTSETAAFLRTALEVLPTEQRRAIDLAFFGGLTQLEISELLGVPLGTVKARIRRGMLTLRDALEGHL